VEKNGDDAGEDMTLLYPYLLRQLFDFQPHYFTPPSSLFYVFLCLFLLFFFFFFTGFLGHCVFFCFC